MIHLSETGYYAGRRLCANADHAEESVHAIYAPLHKPEFREKCCPHCLKIWAMEAYDEGDEMPDYIKDIRG